MALSLNASVRTSPPPLRGRWRVAPEGGAQSRKGSPSIPPTPALPRKGGGGEARIGTWSLATACCVSAILAALASPAAAQDVGRGKALFEQCTACHSFDLAKNETGPTLKGVFGRKSAAVEDFLYSPAMRRANQVWTTELIDAFLADPQAAPFRGNKMPFAGMADAGQRADLIAFLKQAAAP